MDLPEQIVYDFCHFLYDVYGKYEKVCIIAYKVRKENAWQTKIGLNQRGNFEVLIKRSSQEKVKRLIVDICGSRILPQPLNFRVEIFCRLVFHIHFAHSSQVYSSTPGSPSYFS